MSAATGLATAATLLTSGGVASGASAASVTDVPGAVVVHWFEAQTRIAAAKHWTARTMLTATPGRRRGNLEAYSGA
jgi:hypothetical protein